MPSPAIGWSVAICRKDGSQVLCCSDLGTLPPVWSIRNRRFAVRHKRDLIDHGFKAKVVRVEFTVPVIA